MRYVRALGFVLLAGGGAIVQPALAASAQTAAVTAAAEVRDASGRLIASVSLREVSDQVLLNFTFPDRSALTGAHAIHIHETGRCDPPDFATAGGIFNPFGKQHGLKNSSGPMAGDILSLIIGPSGLAGYNTSAPLATLSPGPASLLRPGGTSIVIFAQVDDDQSQPEGNAGARLACGVIVAGDLASSASSSDQRTLSAANSADLDLPSAILIGVLGALLIASGIFLRRASPAPDR
jgi:Cu-Zn family superoxide dismutase